MAGFVELGAITSFSFLRGASHPEEMVETAAERGLAAIGIADRNSLAGMVRAHQAAKEAGIRLLVGARLVPEDGPEILCYPTDRAAYGRLCRLLSEGKLAAEKGACRLTLDGISAAAEGQVLIALPPAPPALPGRAFEAALARLVRAAPGCVFLGAQHRRRGGDRARIARLAALAGRAGAPLVALGDPLYHAPHRRPLQDVLTCIREGWTLDTAGTRLEPAADRHLKSPDEMAGLFRGHEAALARTAEIAARCRFSLDELAYRYPREPVPEGATPQSHLATLAWEGARARYGATVPDRVAALLEKELGLIAELGYAQYFLTVHDIVAWARERGILCQGRGSAANSAVCFCLGITSVDPSKSQLLFERFISRERREPPDIDVDFEHERREEVIQYVYARYGRHRAALAATVISYRPRSALREVCKALGLSDDIATALAGTVWGSWGRDIDESHVRAAGLDPAAPPIRRAILLARELVGFPRHLSQHVGGFVLTQDPLVETVPVGNAAMEDRTFIEWDKDDLEAVGLMKVDLLSLGMLSCVARAFGLLSQMKRIDLDLARVPPECPMVYDMLCRADSLGVFQVESRAQMNMLPRMRPRCFYDLVIEVAIVRPGPIQGDMVHPYLRRRAGEEPVVYPRPAPGHGPADELEAILGRTLGVPLFQEQAMQIAIDAARFTPEEANGLRKAMATFRRVGTIRHFEEKMVAGMVARGYEPDFAARCFEQIKGFGEYGFPESHAASFALLVYVSSWLKCHHPEVFAAALLNAQPMGFYAPAQIVRDAREHGVEVRPADVNRSLWDCTLEPPETDAPAAPGDDGAPPPPEGGPRLALRLGLRVIDGLALGEAEALIAARGDGYGGPSEVRRRAGVSRAALERLAAADAFRSTGLDRRAALWAVRGEAEGPGLPLFDAADAAGEGADPPAELPEMPLCEHVVQDFQTTRLSLRAHPVTFLRAGYRGLGLAPTAEAVAAPDGARVRTGGVVLVRQKPGTASGVVFVTIEDETGIANLVVWPRIAAAHRPALMGARLLAVSARVQRAGEVVHLVVERMADRSADLGLLSEDAARAMGTRAIARADEVLSPTGEDRRGTPGRMAGPQDPAPHRRPRPTHPREERILPGSRDFR
jgi:error-prone DNA polymerase